MASSHGPMVASTSSTHRGGDEAHGYDEFAHIYVDGGVTIQRFLRAGLIDRLIITRVPVLIGSGIPLFGATSRDIILKHVATRQYANGAVQSEYVVAA